MLLLSTQFPCLAPEINLKKFPLYFQSADEQERNPSGMSGISGASTPVSGRSTPISKRKIGSVQTSSLPSSALAQALDSLNKTLDDAQIFGDFVASSIRELDSVEKQQALKRALNRALLDFQDAQHQAPYQAPYRAPPQAPYPFASNSNPTTPSNLNLPPFGTIYQSVDPNDPFGSQTYQNL